MELTSAAHWAAPQVVDVVDGTHTLRVWPAARVSGRFVIEAAKDEVPSTFQLRMETPPGATTPPIPTTTSQCAISDDGSWSCVVPRVKLDLVLRANGFIPHYRWDITPTGSPTHDLGRLALQPAASVIAWLDASSLRLMKKPARARLITLAMNDSSPLAERLNRPVAEASFNSRGMVQLTSVPPGEYTLEIEAEGFATARFPGLGVFPRSESRLATAVQLERPLDIVLTIRPALGPDRTPWHIAVHRLEELTGRSVPVSRGMAGEDGTYRLQQQPAAKYSVTVRTAQGSMFASRRVVVTGPGDAHPIIEMSAVGVAGKVTMADEPLAAELLFGGESSGERIRMAADADGAFRGVVPRTGEWEVVVRNEEAAINAVVQVAITEAAEDLVIEVPATEVAGWVVRPEGTRARHARLAVHTAAGTITGLADESGGFRFRGLTPGRVLLAARDRETGEGSKVREVSASVDMPVSDIELQIISEADVTGVVVSQGQPVVGARVITYARGDGSAPARQALTGVDGTFNVPVKVTAKELVVLVGAAGRTFQAFSVPATAEKPRFELEPVGGTVRMKFSPAVENMRLHYNGIVVPLSDLLGWAHAQGQTPPDDSTFVFPNVAPGVYQLCFTPVKGGAEVCRAQTLARNATIELTTP